MALVNFPPARHRSREMAIDCYLFPLLNGIRLPRAVQSGVQ